MRVSLEKYFCSGVGEGKEIFVLIIETFRISSRVVILEKVYNNCRISRKNKFIIWIGIRLSCNSFK